MMLCRMYGQALISLLPKRAIKLLGMIRSMKMRRNLPLAAKRQARTASRNACMTDSIAKMVCDLQIAFREGLTAHREYERLISKGVRHDPALRASLGVSGAEARQRQVAEIKSMLERNRLHRSSDRASETSPRPSMRLLPVDANTPASGVDIIPGMGCI
jgi:hypothetical protein